MLTVGFFILVSIASTNTATFDQQVRLTRVSTTSQFGQGNIQQAGRPTYPTDTQPLGYRAENPISTNDKVIQYPQNINQDSFQHNQNHYHHHIHNHDHSNKHPELSGQLSGDGRASYPSVIPSNRNVYRTNQTTDRYNRGALTINNSNRSLVSNTNMNNPGYSKDHQMVFPNDGDINRVFGDPFSQKTPFIKPLNSRSTSRNCTYGLCDEVDDYPEERILKIIENSIDLRQYFTNLATNGPDFILNRFGDDENTLCPTMVHTQFPRSAPNTENEERMLVNVGDYKQGIVFETCAKEASPCKFAEAFPNDITTSCKQKYTVRRLMAVGKESDKAVFDNFHLPSCCVCVTKKN